MSEWGVGVGNVEGIRCPLGLKIRTTMRPNIMRSNKKMHFRFPVFFWYLLEMMIGVRLNISFKGRGHTGLLL